jgi:hypothetical protein
MVHSVILTHLCTVPFPTIYWNFNLGFRNISPDRLSSSWQKLNTKLYINNVNCFLQANDFTLSRRLITLNSKFTTF